MQPIARSDRLFFIYGGDKACFGSAINKNRPVGPPVRPAAFYAPQDPWRRDVGGLQPDEIHLFEIIVIFVKQETILRKGEGVERKVNRKSNTMTVDVFISYRRDGGRDSARSVELALKGEGFERIFFDYNSLRDGVFNEQIFEAIDSCKDYLLILSDGALDRCANDGDWVAMEIRRALTADCKIVPIRVGEGDFRWPENLPKDLRILKSIQFLNLRNDEYFHDSIRHLIERMESKPTRIEKTGPTSTPDFILSLAVDETCELSIDGERIRKIRKGKKAQISFLERQKSYRLALKSLAISADCIEFDMTVPQFAKSLEKQISFSKMREERSALEMENRKKLANERVERRRKKENRRGLLQLYSFVDEEFEGRTLVGENHDGHLLYGFVDQEGFEVIPCVYLDAVHFSEGLAAVFDGSFWSYVDEYGNVVLSRVSETPGLFMRHVVPVSRNKSFGLIDAHGQEVLPFDYSLITHAFDPFVVARALSGRYHIFGLDGNPMTAYRSYESVELESVSIGCQKKSPAWKIVYPCYIKMNNRIGLLSSKGELLFKCVADKMEPFGRDPQVDRIEQLSDWYLWRGSGFLFWGVAHELLKFQVKGLYGLLNPDTGKVIIPARYRHLSLSESGFLFSYIGDSAEYGRENHFGMMSEDGSVLVPPDYCAIFCYRHLFICFKENEFSRIRSLFESSEDYDSSLRLQSAISLFLFAIARKDENALRFLPQLGNDSFDVSLYNRFHLEADTLHLEGVAQAEEMKEERLTLTHSPETGRIVHAVWPLLSSYEKVDYYSYREKHRFILICCNSLYGLLDSKTNSVIVPPVYDRIEIHEDVFWGYDEDSPRLTPTVCKGNYRDSVRITVSGDCVEFDISGSKLKYSLDIIRELFPFLDVQDFKSPWE